MLRQVKIFTHESIVHYQMDALARLLKDERPVQITLNVKAVKSSIRFEATSEEVEYIRNNLFVKVYVMSDTDDSWSAR
jgi:hypothetical protein